MSGTSTRPGAGRGRPAVTSGVGGDDRARSADPERSDAPSAWVVALAPVPVLIAALAVRPLVQGIAWWVSGVLVAAVLVATLLVVRRRAPGIRFVALVVALIVTSCAPPC